MEGDSPDSLPEWGPVEDDEELMLVANIIQKQAENESPVLPGPRVAELSPAEVAMGRVSQEDSGVCPVWGVFCYSQDPQPSSFYTPNFEEYTGSHNCIIKPPWQMGGSPDEPEITPVKIWSIENPDGVLSHVLMESVKASIATLLTVTILEQLQSECYGCLCDTMDQTEHTCMEPPPKHYLYLNFKNLMERLWNNRFIPGIMRMVKGLGLNVSAYRVLGVSEAILYELQASDNILQKLTKLSDEFLGLGMGHAALISDLVDFWSHKTCSTHSFRNMNSLNLRTPNVTF